jgi:hypothetical protein
MEFNPLWDLLADLGIKLPNPERVQPEKNPKKLSPRERMQQRRAELQAAMRTESPRDLMAALEQLLSEEVGQSMRRSGQRRGKR